MAIGRGQALTGHGTDAVAAATPRPDVRDDLIQLSCQVCPDGLATVAIRGDLDLATADPTARSARICPGWPSVTHAAWAR
jgi:hypothetical protein